jgi:hypothetical protein
LYETLGFEVIDTETQYLRTRARTFHQEALPLRPLSSSELRAAYELARASMSDKLRMFRPPSISEYGVKFEDRLAERTLDFFIMQKTERYGYFQDDVMKATVVLQAQRIGTPHKLEIRVLPEARGSIETGLVAAATARLDRIAGRDIEARVLTSHTALVNALADAGFIPTKGLTLMAKGFRK